MLPGVTEQAAAKINLALHVLGRRADGYHELDSVVAFASVGDVLELKVAPETTLIVNGPFAGDVPVTSDNLVLKVHAALAAHMNVPAVAMRLTKNLPVASGIGGGSADAAAALRGVLRLAYVQLDADVLNGIALKLGADVPVCLHGKACRMQGVGEVITPLNTLPAAHIVLVNPLQACGTADVFRTMGLKAGDVLGQSLDVANPGSWRNDMAAAACRILPVISNVLAALQQLPDTVAVRMSGSGATCFALFETRDSAAQAALKLREQYVGWWVVAAHLT
jgi:4-diphosphocytidyl-2-C-methyl-D-erythritol kinase